MATIIDFSPTADESDALATAAKKTNQSLPEPLVPAASTSLDIASDHDAGLQFLNNAPDILFLAEYAPNGVFAGVLIVFENYYNATHYEVFKSDMFSVEPSFERILFLDAGSLEEETARYASYITETLKIPLVNGDYYAILDTHVQQDRIYQYQLGAGYYPRGSNVDYEVILQSKNLVNPIAITAPKDTIFDLSQKVFGDANYAWVIAVCNKNLQFFGRDASTQPVSQFLTEGSQIFVPSDINILIEMINEAIYFFGLKYTLSNLLNRTKNPTELPGFYAEVLASVNEKSQTFSYATLQNNLVKVFPQYKRLTDLLTNPNAELGTKSVVDLGKFVSNIPVKIPSYSDTTSFSTFGDLTLMFLRLNSIYITALYAFDNAAQIQQWFPAPPPSSDSIINGLFHKK